MRGVEEETSAVQWPRWADLEDDPQAPPPVGTQVAGCRLECRLGEGGQGTVYRARRNDGQRFALKFLALSRSGWAWRELEVGLRLRYRGSLQVLGHGLWPPTRPCFLYLVFPYVRGRPLPDWARQHNPSAREVIRVMRELAQQVGDIHRAGVVHRDIKGANILIGHEDGRPVLVDFGVGTYVGAPEITHPMSMPGTPHYRSPEALRFRRGHVGEHSPARRSDDLWALGVVLYVLLTGSHPFEPLEPRAGEGALADLILHEEPEAPHERNPRVPRALSELCLRMLEKLREARFQTAWGVDEALAEVLTDADATWDAPLCEAWSAEEVTTPQEEALDLGDWMDKTRRLRLYARRHARRGRPLPPDRATTLPLTPEAAPPEEHRADPVAALSDLQPPRPWVSRAWALMCLLVLLLPWTVSREPFRQERELAPPGGVPEVVSAPLPSVTPSKDIPRVKTSQQAVDPRPPQQKSSSRLGGLAKACGSALAVGQLACATAPASTAASAQPVMEDAPPPPAECPAGAVENMKAMGVERLARTGVLFQHGKDLVQAMPRVLHQGDQFLLEFEWEKFPRNTLFTGPVLFGKNRVYVRITQALIPGRSEPLPVCMELYNHTDRKRGSPLEPGSEPGAPKIMSLLILKAVERFE